MCWLNHNSRWKSNKRNKRPLLYRCILKIKSSNLYVTEIDESFSFLLYRQYWNVYWLCEISNSNHFSSVGLDIVNLWICHKQQLYCVEKVCVGFAKKPQRNWVTTVGVLQNVHVHQTSSAHRTTFLHIWKVLRCLYS